MRYAISAKPPIRLDELAVSFRTAIESAMRECPGETEEEGGFIPAKDTPYGKEFTFIKITNQNTGQPHATALYEPDREEYGAKIVVGAYGAGFRNHGSFHTHPAGCRALPSMTDLTRLFNGQPVNVIYSPSLRDLRIYEDSQTHEDMVSWTMTKVLLEPATQPAAQT